jgi:LysR family glycine cleavage system transcriptional activator
MSFSHCIERAIIAKAPSRDGNQRGILMARQLPPLNAVKAFEAAARHLNFNRAAEELCVTQGAISRQIKILEEHYGATLFHRRPRSIVLTDAGNLLLPAVRAAFDELDTASRRLRGIERSRVLTISSTPSFAIKWLYPRLFRFNEAEPEIEVRTLNVVRTVDFSHEDLDVAIRIGRPDASGEPQFMMAPLNALNGIRVTRLMDDRPIPVCSPAFFHRHRPFRSLADIDEGLLIHMASRLDAWANWYRAEGHPEPQLRKHVYGHFFLGVEAALHGLGIALVPHVHVRDDISAGRLVMPFDKRPDSAEAYYLLCRERQWRTPKIVAFRRWVVAETERWNAENAAEGDIGRPMSEPDPLIPAVSGTA